jgi:hypothetical protein
LRAEPVAARQRRLAAISSRKLTAGVIESCAPGLTRERNAQDLA